MDELKQRISDTLEAELARVYDENWITSGDVTPDQFLKWEEITSAAANLFLELIKQNK